jgi:uncharacterized protein (DUF427 family)
MTQAFKAHEVGLIGEVDHRVIMEPTPQRIRVFFNGETIADSKNVMIQHETKHQPIYYFPFADVRMELMELTGSTTT